MDDLEMGIDFVDDPIKKFLLHKLEEIRSNNVDLEEQINRRKQIVKDCLGDMESKLSDNLLKITGTWTKVFDGKYIIGVFVEAAQPERIFNDIHLVLQWDCRLPLVYTTKVFTRYQLRQNKPKLCSSKKILKLAKALEDTSLKSEPLQNEWIFSNKINGSGSIVICSDIPELNEKNELNLSGIIVYYCGSDQYHLSLPNMIITVKDLTSNAHEIKSTDLIKGNEPSYLSIMASNEKHSLVAKLPTANFKYFQNQLEFECGFTKINAFTNACTFYVDGIASSINGNILQLENDSADTSLYGIKMYSRNQTSFQFLLHYLHQHIPGIIILSEKYIHHLEKNSTSNTYTSQAELNKNPCYDTLLKKFGTSLESQINAVENFCSKRLDELPDDIVETDTVNLNVCIKDYKRFRNNLADIEFESDKLYKEIETIDPNLGDVSILQ